MLHYVKVMSQRRQLLKITYSVRLVRVGSSGHRIEGVAPCGVESRTDSDPQFDVLAPQETGRMKQD